MPRIVVVVATALAVVVAGCGSDDKERRVTAVRLTVDQPVDSALTRDDSIQVRGRVTPANASVKVEGRRTSVSGGRFSARVSLDPGTNVVDVMAGAPDARPAMLALRIQREVDVRVPTLAGATPDDAKDALAALGLKADVQEEGGPFDFLLPEQARVCSTDPPADSQVPPGTTVTVVIAKSC